MAAPQQSIPGRLTRGARTRDRLLDSARIAFRGVGWSRARVEDVCREAGVGHGTFYAYYANKTAVLEALVRRHAADLDALLAGPWGTPGAPAADPRPDVRRIIAGYVEITRRDADVREIWSSAAPSEPELAALVAEVRAGFVHRVEEALTAAAGAGLARPALDIATAAVALAAMVEQTVALGLAGGAHTLGDRLIDGLTDLWVAAAYAPRDS